MSGDQDDPYGIAKAGRDSLSHADGCNCAWCFSRRWHIENPNRCHVCGGTRNHASHDPPYDNARGLIVLDGRR